MCKDQHGCRYLQKKLEESVPEHRDMIFRETFSHFADLMTGKTFSNKGLMSGDTRSRSLWQLFMSKVVGILDRRAAQLDL